MATKARAIVLASSWCKGCGICVEFCPQRVFAAEPLTGLVRVERPEACTGCRLCELLCPDFVISVEEGPDATDGTGATDGAVRG